MTRQITREELVQALIAAKGEKRGAARLLGISHPTLYRWITRHGVKPEAYLSAAVTAESAVRAETAERMEAFEPGNKSPNSNESIGQRRGNVRTLQPVATQAAVMPSQHEGGGAGDQENRKSRTFYLSEADYTAIAAATLDLSFYTRRRLSPSDVLAMLLRSHLADLVAAHERAHNRPAPASKSSGSRKR